MLDDVGTRQDFAKQLTQLRERAGLTVRDVARALKVPTSTIGGYFGGRYLPPPGQLRTLLLVHGVTDPDQVDSWLAALRRVRRAPGRRPAATPVPYRGLESFRSQDADWFFGREALTATLIEHLRDLHGREQRGKGGLLLVAGPSGSGKSSLLRAGLIPALRAGALESGALESGALKSGALGIPGSASWPVVLMTPGTRPDGELADLLADPRQVVIIDQLEEIFTVFEERERDGFISGLHAPAALVVAGLRADFYPQALRYPLLAAASQDHQVVVGPMTEPELRSAITGPAHRARLDIEDGLVEVLLRDVDPGALPLLSHALLTTWQHSRRGTLTLADYQASGGIRGAVASTAEEGYGELESGQQNVARQVFMRLVHVADDTADTRRRVPRNELMLSHGDVEPVLDAFIARRLITAETDDVQIAHEALLHAWPRLREWIDADRAGARIHRQLTIAAGLWQDSGREPGALYSGGRLAAAEEWVSQPAHAGDLNTLERTFFEVSVERRRAEEKTARRRHRRLQQLVGALAALSLVTASLAIAAFQQKDAATGQRDVAISQQVAIEASQLRGSDTALAMQLSLAAYRISPTSEALSGLLDSAGGVAATRMLGMAGAELHSVAFDPGKAILAAGGGDGTVWLWHLSRSGHPASLGAPLTGGGPVTSVAFSPDGRTLAAGTAAGTVRLWNVTDPRHPAVLADQAARPLGEQLTGGVNCVAFSPDGRVLAAATSDGQVFLWRAAGLAAITTLSAGTGQVNSVTFSPNGKVLAAGGSSGRVWLWDLAGRALMSLSGAANGVNAVAFSPDGAMLAAGGDDSDVRIWDISTGHQIAVLTGARSWIYSVAFSPRGNALAAGSADDNAYVWNLSGGKLAATLPHPAPVLSVAYGPGGSLATADADGTARLWRLPGPVLPGAPGSVFTVAFGPGTSDLAVATAPPGAPGAVQLWDTTDPGQPVPLGPPLASSADLDGTVGYGLGGRLAAGGGKGGIALWDVQDPQHPRALPPPPTSLDTAIQYVVFDRTGRLMAAAGSDGRIELWDTADFARAVPLAVLPGDHVPPDEQAVYAVAFAPGDRLLASAGADGTVALWDISHPGQPRRLGPPVARLTDAAYQVNFSPDGHILAASGADGKVRLWDVIDPVRPRLLSTLSGPAGIVYDVAFSPDGHTLATADGDKTVTLWNITKPASPSRLGALTGPAGTVFSVAFSPDGASIAAGSQDDTTRLWPATAATAAAYTCSMAGSPITPAEWAQYIPGLPYNPPCTGQ